MKQRGAAATTTTAVRASRNCCDSKTQILRSSNECLHLRRKPNVISSYHRRDETQTSLLSSAAWLPPIFRTPRSSILASFKKFFSTGLAARGHMNLEFAVLMDEEGHMNLTLSGYGPSLEV